MVDYASNTSLDRTDLRILSELQKSGRISNVALSKRVNLSPTPCLERVKRLEKNGFINGYHAELNADQLHAGLLVFVQVSLDRTTPDIFARFTEALTPLDQVQECHMVAGGFDYLLKLRFSDMAAYRQFLGKELTALPGIMQTHTYFVMEEVKQTAAIPLPLVAR
ncbi:MAG: winged helix-turn-helix transcriptional regulator [Gammaproteobacteria bacterium]|nr:winged helix-turn-helix transcriptional regulator [Gammaproteobacteria bacterium]